MNDLIESGAASVSDPDGALIVANAIGAVVGDGGGDGPPTIGLEVGTKAVDATEVRARFIYRKLVTFSFSECCQCSY